jgi:hypothetical protein
MKKIILMALLAVGVMATFSACEKTDYQHPMHRK